MNNLARFQLEMKQCNPYMRYVRFKQTAHTKLMARNQLVAQFKRFIWVASQLQGMDWECNDTELLFQCDELKISVALS